MNNEVKLLQFPNGKVCKPHRKSMVSLLTLASASSLFHSTQEWMLRTGPFTQTMLATFIDLSINLQEVSTSLSALIHFFKWNLKKLIKDSSEKKVPIFSPFSLFHHTISLTMATRQVKTALSSWSKEEGRAILIIHSTDSQIYMTSNNQCSTYTHMSETFGHWISEHRMVSSLSAHLRQLQLMALPCLWSLPQTGNATPE